MALFTFILEYRGGTYIAQVKAEDVTRALARWLDTFDLDGVFGLTSRSRDHLRACFQDESHVPVPVDGTVNVWCTHSLVRGKGALLNIVGTSARAPAAGRRRRG